MGPWTPWSSKSSPPMGGDQTKMRFFEESIRKKKWPTDQSVPSIIRKARRLLRILIWLAIRNLPRRDGNEDISRHIRAWPVFTIPTPQRAPLDIPAKK